MQVREETQLRLYREMVRIRRIEEAIAREYHSQEMRCPVHLSIGQEAVPVGVCAALRPTDYMMSTHRAHAHYLAKGGSLKRMIAELYGKMSGCTGGKGGSMHLIDLSCGFLGSTPIVGSSFPVAVGTALATQMKGRDEVTVVFLGEGMAEEGVFSESLNFAALKRLPVLFVCEDNLYSVYTPLDQRQPPGRRQSTIAEAHGIPALRGNGNDVEEVSRITAKAMEAILDLQGPVFLELATYRWLEHCGPNYDNHIGYRTEEEYLKWKETCPIARCEREFGIADPDWLMEIDEEIDAAFRFARISPFPEPEAGRENVYAN